MPIETAHDRLRRVVREAIHDRGVSVHRAAIEAGVDPNALRPFLAGRRSMHTASLGKVMEAFDLEVRPAPGRTA
jgi:lambda repressor-like predicted transcriptional regulator